MTAWLTENWPFAVSILALVVMALTVIVLFSPLLRPEPTGVVPSSVLDDTTAP